MMKKEGLLKLGIGAAMAVALGAVSFFVRAGWAGNGDPKPSPGPEAQALNRAVRTQPAPLPPDFEELCRTAGV